MINLLFVGLILFSIELKSQTLETPNTSPVHTLGAIEKDISLSESELKMIEEYSKNIDIEEELIFSDEQVIVPNISSIPSFSRNF